MRTPPTYALALLLLAVAAPACAQQLPAPTPEQRQALQARWQAADTNQDGLVDRNEAQALPPIANHFDELDANGDGQLSQEEMRNLVQDRLRAADVDQDGYIDRAEAEASLPRVARIFDRLDANADGQLSTDEVQQVVSRFRGRRQR